MPQGVKEDDEEEEDDDDDGDRSRMHCTPACSGI